MIRRVGDSYGVRTIDDLLVGFKWIAQAIDANGPEKFLYGCEESHGYMAGSHVRDKDAAVACMLACEMAAGLKAAGKTLHEKLDDLFWQHGVHAERMASVMMPGSDGMERMKQVMARFRSDPPEGDRRHRGRPAARLPAKRDHQSRRHDRAPARAASATL